GQCTGWRSGCVLAVKAKSGLETFRTLSRSRGTRRGSNHVTQLWLSPLVLLIADLTGVLDAEYPGEVPDRRRSSAASLVAFGVVLPSEQLSALVRITHCGWLGGARAPVGGCKPAFPGDIEQDFAIAVSALRHQDVESSNKSSSVKPLANRRGREVR